MGMFDTIRLDGIELPDMSMTRSLDEYQTKSLDRTLAYYRVTHDGRLVVKDENRMHLGVRFKPTTYSGSVYIYKEGQGLTLTFERGRLSSIEMD